MKKIPVGILGATGMVGQQYLQLLASHPQFDVVFAAASPQSAGKKLGALCLKSIEAIDEAQSCCSFVFSALPTESAKEWEARYAAAGLPVMSNASHHRLDPDVPLLIPEVNPAHLAIIPVQQKRRGWKRGFIIAKPNCSLQSYLMPLAPLHDRFRVQKLIVTTLQAASGAGYPGVSSLDLIDNAIPYIAGEEEKSEIEPRKIWGEIQGEEIVSAQGIDIAAHCNRVPVLDGHLACVSVQFAQKPNLDEILALWEEYRPLPQQLRLFSAPEKPVVYSSEKDRPQPRLDRDAGRGMAVTVGRLRSCPLFNVRFVALSHNTLRGAAGGGVLNAELLLSQGYLQ